MNSSKLHRITFSAVVGALYAVLTIVLPQTSYGPVQLRFAEALCVLPFLYPETVPGLFIGCLIANLLSPYGAADIVFGSLATLLSAFLASKMPNKYLSPLPCIFCNGVIVGGLISWYETGFSSAFLPAFVYNGGTVAAGEALVCYTLGLLLLRAMPKIMEKVRK